MKKQLILILFLLGNLTTSFSQFKKTAFNNLVGTYDGFTITKDGLENSNNVKVELTADFNVKITENFDGLLVEHINQKVNPQAAGFDKDENYLFDFKPTSKQNEFNTVRITIYKEPIFPNTEFNMSIGFTKGEKEEYFLFGIKKDGGNPKQPNKNIDFSDIYQSVLYTNKIEKNTYGDFKVEWYPSHDFGYLRFKHLKNVFKITKIEHGYLLQNENRDDIELEYEYGYGKKMTLKKIRKGNLLFDKEKVKKYKEQGDVQNNKEEFILNICSSFYYLIDSRFKPRENYTLTHDNKLKGKGIQFFMEEGQPIVYAGGFQNGQFQGKGKFILVNRIDKGHFENGTRHGHIFMDMVDGSQASGQYVNGVQEGLWKIKLSNGATFEKVFKNGEVVSSTPTNTGVKNTQIAKHVEDAQYQLKSSKRYINEIVDIANGCSDRTTLRSYQVCLRPLKRKIDLFTVGIVAADRELTKAIKEADRIGCTQALQILKNAEDDLWEANGKFGEAYKAVTETYHATTVSNVRAEFRKCKAALQKATKAMDEYYFWINSLATQTCYEYSNTDNSTLPSRTSSKSKASSNNSSSSSSKKITTSQESSTVTSGAVVYPAITGKYEGNNLLLLMGRKLDDPAVQRLFNDAAFQFKESTTAIPKGQRMFYATKDNCSVTFKNGIIYELVLSQDYFDKNEYFKNKLPLDIPLAKPLGRMKSIKGDWKLTKYGSIHTYKLSKYQLYFKVSSDVDKDGLISKVQINAYDIKDWNSYYRQFQ